MQISRIIVALIAAPLSGSLVYVLLARLDTMSMSHGPQGDDFTTTFIGMAVAAVLFEVFVLLPVAYLLRGRMRFRLAVTTIGVAAWAALTSPGLALLGQNALSVAITTTQLLALGLPVVLVFALLVRSGNVS